jgi:hypothetical protein
LAGYLPSTALLYVMLFRCTDYGWPRAIGYALVAAAGFTWVFVWLARVALP